MAVIKDPIPEEDKLEAIPMNKFEPLGNGIFLVPREYLTIAEKTVPKDGEVQEGDFAFENPRLGMGFHDVFNAEGMGKEDIDDLRTSIKEDGLDHPLLCRPKNGEVQVVNGMRRLLQVDHFIKTGSNVYDKTTGKMVNASDLFKKGGIPCRIEEMSDLEAYRRANSTDDASKPHGDAARIAQIRYFAQAGRSDQDIMAACGKSIDWVNRMKPVAIGLDKDTFQAFAAGAIAFNVAEYLSQYDDVEKRKEVLKSLLVKAKERHDAMVIEAESHIKATASKVEKAKAQVAAAKKKGSEAEEEARQALEEAEQKHTAAKIKKKSVKKKKTQVTRRDLPRASNPRAGGANKKKTSQGDGQPNGVVKRLTSSKQLKHWYEPAVEATKAIKNGDPEGKLDDRVDPEFFFIVQLLHEKADAGETDLNKIGRLWTKQADRRGALANGQGRAKQTAKKKSSSS